MHMELRFFYFMYQESYSSLKASIKLLVHMELRFFYFIFASKYDHKISEEKKKIIASDNKNNLKHYEKERESTFFFQLKRKAMDGYINKPSPQGYLKKYSINDFSQYGNAFNLSKGKSQKVPNELKLVG